MGLDHAVSASIPELLIFKPTLLSITKFSKDDTTGNVFNGNVVGSLHTAS